MKMYKFKTEGAAIRAISAVLILMGLVSTWLDF